eukprot:CAMPEP_0206213460 /NCGR_PEP_ID=MMETSP0047_2-20121206/1136_1 /ASSEMBLY_ACC=CAM_ASM_000192 /TAXON_ID=195065 /ORGANISM="Chroomonas mesostigmatica_cf, Strain CCMP1168" /LENGTH=57 /DNA_ID=CAMNT_0053635615 /DNA_START=511 /DNA_END=684 /DNA_ORIENTATION=+
MLREGIWSPRIVCAQKALKSAEAALAFSPSPARLSKHSSSSSKKSLKRPYAFAAVPG